MTKTEQREQDHGASLGSDAQVPASTEAHTAESLDLEEIRDEWLDSFCARHIPEAFHEEFHELIAAHAGAVRAPLEQRIKFLELLVGSVSVVEGEASGPNGAGAKRNTSTLTVGRSTDTGTPQHE